jgi:hypothetical protein
MTLPRNKCRCGKTKDRRAKECFVCHYGPVEVELVPTGFAPVESPDPVKETFQWLIQQSRGEIS